MASLRKWKVYLKNYFVPVKIKLLLIINKKTPPKKIVRRRENCVRKNNILVKNTLEGYFWPENEKKGQLWDSKQIQKLTIRGEIWRSS